jgi:hypothetical protein
MQIATNAVLWFISMAEENKPKEAVHGKKVLKVEGLSKTYGKTVAVDNISFQVLRARAVDRRKPWSAHNRGRDFARHFSRRNSDIGKNIQVGINKADIVQRSALAV